MNDNKHKVVVGADDNPSNLKLMEMALRANGYTFFGAKNGVECVELAYKIQPRLFLLDVQMPGIDGFETCRRIRTVTELKTVPVLFVTACNTRDEVARAMQVGGNDFLVKPITASKLMDRVNHWL